MSSLLQISFIKVFSTMASWCGSCALSTLACRCQGYIVSFCGSAGFEVFFHAVRWSSLIWRFVDLDGWIRCSPITWLFGSNYLFRFVSICLEWMLFILMPLLPLLLLPKGIYILLQHSPIATWERNKFQNDSLSPAKLNCKSHLLKRFRLWHHDVVRVHWQVCLVDGKDILYHFVVQQVLRFPFTLWDEVA